MKAEARSPATAIPVSAGLVVPFEGLGEPLHGLKPAETKYTVKTLFNKAANKQLALLGEFGYDNGGTLACWADLDYVVPFAARDEETGKQIYPGYYKVSYGCTVGLFDKDGQLLDSEGNFDRVRDVYFGPWLCDNNERSVVVVTFLDGVFVYSIDANKRLNEAFHSSVISKTAAQYYTDLFMDIDNDFHEEAVIVVPGNGNVPSASTLIGSNYYYLNSDSKLPDGRSVNELTGGVIAVDILEASNAPFTYYPDWSLDDLPY